MVFPVPFYTLMVRGFEKAVKKRRAPDVAGGCASQKTKAFVSRNKGVIFLSDIAQCGITSFVCADIVFFICFMGGQATKRRWAGLFFPRASVGAGGVKTWADAREENFGRKRLKGLLINRFFCLGLEEVPGQVASLRSLCYSKFNCYRVMLHGKCLKVGFQEKRGRTDVRSEKNSGRGR